MGKKLYIIANWKSNKTEPETREWFQEFSIFNFQFSMREQKEIIICPSFTLLPILKSYVLNHKSSFRLGAQDISFLTEGSYTGEVNGRQVKEFADYVIIGHSERRKNFKEDEEIIKKKIILAKKYGLIAILCISDISQIPDSQFMIHNSEIIIAYEPLFAIGTGNPDSSVNANIVAGKIKNKNKTVQQVLYGGSVTSKNVNSFTQMPSIDGVLVGRASLDAGEFLAIIKNA